MVLSPQASRKSGRTPCKKRCARWISERSWALRFSSCGVGARALRRMPAGIRLNALAPTPQDENLSAQLRSEIHRAHRFLQGVRPDFRLACGESTIADDSDDRTTRPLPSARTAH